MTFCGSQTIVATGPFGQAATVVKCRSWTCPNCQPERQKQLIALGFSGQPNRFITLTCRRGEHATPVAAAAALASAWRIIVKRWKRLKETNKCEYLCVLEAHKSGWPHLHILFRGPWIDQKWLSGVAADILNSPIVHVTFLSSGSMHAAYVAKYCGKAPHKFGHTKRYWTTRHYSLSRRTDAAPVFHDRLEIERTDQKIDTIIADWHRYGKATYNITPNITAWGTLWVPPFHKRPRPRTSSAWRKFVSRNKKATGRKFESEV